MEHYLPYNIADPASKRELDSLIETWITRDQAVHAKYVNEWNTADQRLNNDYVPTGFTTAHSQLLSLKNDPRTGEQESTLLKKEYVKVPRTRPNHEAVLGDFSTFRRKLLLRGRNPTDRNRAKVLQSRIEHIEDQEMIPERIYFTAMDNAFAKGLSWMKLVYKPEGNNLKGKFEASEVSCRDVFVDSGSRGAYFASSKRFIQRVRIRVNDAKKRFRKYPFFDSNLLGVDSEYEQGYEKSEYVEEDYATFYEVHFAELTTEYFFLNEKTGEVEEIEEDLYEALSENPNTANKVFIGKQEDEWYVAFYHRTMGTFFLSHNPLGMPTLVPMINIHTDARLYPLGDVRIYSELQDLLETLVTVFLENAKRSNIPIAEVDENLWTTYKNEIQHVLKHGGAAPGLKGLHYAQALNPALTNLIPWVIGWIQDAVSRHAASMGELPAKQIAKETIQTLIAKDRQSHGRKDVMLKYSLTMFAKLMTKMIMLFDSEPDFILVRDARPGSPDYIPINQVFTEHEYLEMLTSIFNLPQPETEEEQIEFARVIATARRRFEMGNDVKPVEAMGYLVQGKFFTEDQVRGMLDETGMEFAEFAEIYKVIPYQGTIYSVNELNLNVDIDVRYEISTDYQEDPEYRANLALLLNARGAMSRVDMLKELNLPNPEELVANVDSENQAIQLAKQLVADPQLMQIVRAAIASTQKSNGQGVKVG